MSGPVAPAPPDVAHCCEAVRRFADRVELTDQQQSWLEALLLEAWAKGRLEAATTAKRFITELGTQSGEIR